MDDLTPPPTNSLIQWLSRYLRFSICPSHYNDLSLRWNGWHQIFVFCSSRSLISPRWRRCMQWQIGSVAVVIKCRILENPFRLPAGCIQIEEELYVKSGPHATQQRKWVANSESRSFQSSLKGWSDFDKLSEWFSQLFYKLISFLDSIDTSIYTCMKVYRHWFDINIILTLDSKYLKGYLRERVRK